MKTLHQISFLILLALFVIPLFLLISKEYFGLFIKYSVYTIPLIVGSVFIINHQVNKKDFINILLILLFSILSLAFSHGGVGSVLVLFVSVLMLQVVASTYFPMNYMRIIPIVGFSLVLLLFIKSFSAVDNFVYYQETDINPNTMAYFIIYGFVYWFAFMDFSGLFKKVLCIILAGLAFYGIVNFASRGAAASLCCFLLMNLLPVRLYKSAYFIGMLWLFLIISILFPLFYVYLYQNHIDMQLFNKSLYTGREGIWLRMFDAFKEKPMSWLFGLGSHAELWAGHQLNVHNNFWAVLVNFGGVGCLLFYSFIIGKVQTLSVYMNNDIIRRLVIGFVSYAFFAGILESTTFWMPLLIYIYLGLGFCLSYKETINHEL